MCRVLFLLRREHGFWNLWRENINLRFQLVPFLLEPGERVEQPRGIIAHGRNKRGVSQVLHRLAQRCNFSNRLPIMDVKNPVGPRASLAFPRSRRRGVCQFPEPGDPVRVCHGCSSAAASIMAHSFWMCWSMRCAFAFAACATASAW